MLKLYGYFASAAIVLSSCVSKPNPFVEYYHRETNFIKASDIKEGEKLQKQHPDEDFVIDDYVLEIGFSKNKEYEEWSKTQNAKKKKFKKVKWTKNNKSYAVELNDEFSDAEIKKIKEEYETRSKAGRGIVNDDDFAEYIEQLKRDRNSTPPGKYMSLEKHSYSVTSLNDFSDYGVSLFYNNGESIRNFKFDYGRGSYEPSYLVKSYESDGIFHNDVKIFRTSTDLPTVGSHVYVDYEHEYPDITYNTTVYIPEEHFVEHKVVSFAIPAWLDVTIVEKNLEGVTFTKSTSAAKKLKKKMLPNQVKDVEYDENGNPVKKKTTTAAKTKKEPAGGMKYITYEFKNVKPFTNDRGGRGPSYNYPHLLIQYNYAQEGETKVPMTGTVEGLYSWYYGLVKQLKNDTVELKKFTQKLIAGKTTDQDKIKAIYYWVQDNIRYIAFEDGIAGFKPEECADVYNNRYGDCKGMANLLVNML
ncbi:MAG: transglutaminase domain-containing protein, partial [Bacteroidia bacterium]|nr:transglutaminase domain-containing protein [Bacteroidia bacterium]